MSRVRRRASDAILLLPLPFRWMDRSIHLGVQLLQSLNTERTQSWQCRPTAARPWDVRSWVEAFPSFIYRAL
ncbi:Stigma-specific protein, Stig1 [Musa troglodytarum]|uniref:Stigma-specific protein, Stig1 n=1 Tax=Musa troglodytarum TaxID=320322 RepID=A0A9E7EYE7_9LILI|nr:Stigma-specific protein, Stig1 [Musa troglodytarum]